MLYVPPTHPKLYQSNASVGVVGGPVTGSSTAHTKGSYASLIDPTTYECFGLWMRARGSASNTNTSILLDVAYGPTGGGNEQILIPDINLGGSQSTGVGRVLFFPVRIPAGVRISARLQSVISSKAVDFGIWVGQKPDYGWSCSRIVAYGEDTANSRGTSVTPGNGSYGSWTSLGTTTRNHKYWTLLEDQLGDQSIATSSATTIALGIGPDSANVTTICELMHSQINDESFAGPMPHYTYQPVKSGTELWARIASAETEARGIVAYGMD